MSPGEKIIAIYLNAKRQPTHLPRSLSLRTLPWPLAFQIICVYIISNFHPAAQIHSHKRAAREQKGQAKALCKSVRLYNNVLISLTPKSSLENSSAFFNASIECNTNSTLCLKKITHVTRVKIIGSRKSFKKRYGK